MSGLIEGFFDQLNNTDFKLWYSKFDPSVLQEETIGVGSWAKKSKNVDDLAERTFFLTSKHLYYKKRASDARVRGVMDLKFVRVSFFEEEVLGGGGLVYRIKFTKNLKYAEILSRDREVFLQWKELLRLLTVQTDFHQKFHVTKKIGKGAFATVYLVQRISDGEQFAVKAFSKAYVNSQDRGKEGLINEIETLQRLDHPNIIKFEEVHESDNSIYLVMELLEGGEICSFNQGKLDQEATHCILKSILQALVHLDKEGIMHRDLKPDNIILKKLNCPISENTLKLVDFGLASSCDVDEYLFRRCGTPGFVAPEVINSKREDGTRFTTKSDIFSTGVIFFFMLTGKIPFEGERFEEVIESNKKAVINFDIEELHSVSSDAMSLLRLMLEVDPEKRLSAADCLRHKFFS